MPADKVQKGAKGILQLLQWQEATGSGTPKAKEVGILTEMTAVGFRFAFKNGEVQATFGDKQRTFKLAVKQPVVRLVCSTGEFLYTDLRISPPE